MRGGDEARRQQLDVERHLGDQDEVRLVVGQRRIGLRQRVESVDGTLSIASPAIRVSRRRTALRRRPAARVAARISSATTPELPIRPAMKTQAGIGVPRPRFSRPSSRAITSDIASDCIVAEITERVMIAGT